MPTIHAQRSRLWENLRAGIRGLKNTPAHAVEQDNKLLFPRPSAAGMTEAGHGPETPR